MMIVDSHAHASPYWCEPVEVLLFQMDSNGVDKTTLTAIHGQTDKKYNQYIIDCARRFRDRIAPVIVVDAQRPDAPKLLQHWANEGARGVRLKAFSRSPGKEPLAVWKACAELGLPVTCHSFKKEDFANDEFIKLIEALPDLPIVIEHLGKPDEEAPYPIYKKMLGLSRYPNVYIKVGGLGEICKRPFPFRDPFYAVEGVPPYIKMVYEAYGPSHMMWGSNYPPCSRLEGYGNTLRYLSEYLDTFCSKKDKQWIFGKTALTLFNFEQDRKAFK